MLATFPQTKLVYGQALFMLTVVAWKPGMKQFPTANISYQRSGDR